MSRSVLFDTETTGLEPLHGHRVLEVAALELVRDLPTGRHWHAIVDPCRDIPEEASRVHGMTSYHVTGKPLFEHVVDDLLAFFGDDELLIAHNAPFDFAFINAELARCGRAGLASARMVDTLALAKARFPGMPNSLDALCRRFGIDLSARTTHNALLDCRLLAEVYVELTGGRQRGLLLAEDGEQRLPAITYAALGARTPRPMLVPEAELAAHAAFVARLKDPVWATG